MEAAEDVKRLWGSIAEKTKRRTGVRQGLRRKKRLEREEIRLQRKTFRRLEAFDRHNL